MYLSRYTHDYVIFDVLLKNLQLYMDRSFVWAIIKDFFKIYFCSFYVCLTTNNCISTQQHDGLYNHPW